MLAFQWDVQPQIKRIKAGLVARGYCVWIDIEQMSGSTIDAMAAAVEGSAVVVFGVSRRYKESPNCRMVNCSITANASSLSDCAAENCCPCDRPTGALYLCCIFVVCFRLFVFSLSQECNYAMQTKVKMIPLMMEAGYAANGVSHAPSPPAVLTLWPPHAISQLKRRSVPPPAAAACSGSASFSARACNTPSSAARWRPSRRLRAR